MKATVSIDSKSELRRECDTPRPSVTPLQEGMGCRITPTINDALPRHPLSERGEGTASGRSDSEAVNKIKRRGVSHPKGSISLHFPRCASAYIAFLLILLFTGCRSHKELQRTDKTDTTATVVKPKPPAPPATENLDYIAVTDYASYRANFSCSVQGITVNGQIRMAKDSVVWLSINKIVELGRAKLTPNRVQFSARLLSKDYDGGYEGLKSRWGIDADYATIEALLMGNCPPDCSKAKEPKRTGDIVTQWYTQGKGKDKRQLTMKVSYTTKLPTEADLYSPATGQRIHLVYGQRQEVNGRKLPTSIGVQINNKQINEQTTIKLDKVKLNEQQNYPFK
ncbi:MAG: DUF4292 domain-containing protein [Bacteroidales bacterium]|nr:DUF4292 domain-containing protein [Bacteroidales bacterium]